MKRILLIFLISITSTTVYCQEAINEKVIGNWIQLNTRATHFIFSKNGDFKFLYGETDIYGALKSVKYKIEMLSDTLHLNIIYKGRNINGKVKRKFIERRVIWLNGDYLTWANYKDLPGITNHIDEYAVLVKDVPTPAKESIKRPLINYLFPKGFKGGAWIAFNQPNGDKPTYDSLGNPILRIPQNGILLTTLHEDVFATANGHYKIWEESQNGSKNRLFKSFEKFEKIDSSCCVPDSLYAFMGGFNQTSRDDINENIFKKPISGNVMSIYIGKYKWFEKNWLHPWDSKME